MSKEDGFEVSIPELTKFRKTNRRNTARRASSDSFYIQMNSNTEENVLQNST